MNLHYVQMPTTHKIHHINIHNRSTTRFTSTYLAVLAQTARYLHRKHMRDFKS